MKTDLLPKALFICTIAVSSLLLNPQYAFAFSGPGAGTLNDPYKIDTCAEFQEIKDDTNAYYELTDEVDCSDTVNWNSGAGFAPMGTFFGELNGNNFAITDLYINRPGSSYVGIFHFLSGATIANIHLSDGTINGGNYSGSFFGAADGGSIIQNCSSSINLTSTAAGGIGGILEDGSTISRCWFTGNNSGSDGYGGGIVAILTASTITNSYSAGGTYTIVGPYNGGIAGVVEEDFFSGDPSTITNVYSTMTMNKGNNIYVGGLVGLISDSTLTNSFSAVVTSNSGIAQQGCITGNNSGTTSGIYYDTYSCLLAKGAGTGTDNATAVNSANATPNYFKGNSTNAPLSSWNFTGVWRTVAGDYPKLITVPGAGANITVTKTNTSLTPNWSFTDNGGRTITGYELKYRANGGSWQTVNTTTTSYTVSNLSSETTYEFWLRAINSEGKSQWVKFTSTTEATAGSETTTTVTPTKKKTVVTYTSNSTDDTESAEIPVETTETPILEEEDIDIPKTTDSLPVTGESPNNRPTLITILLVTSGIAGSAGIIFFFKQNSTKSK